MATISRKAGALRLRESIKAYSGAATNNRLDKRARDLLARLASDGDAGDVFGRLNPRDQRAEACLLTACIEADEIARTFHARMKTQKNALGRARRWDEAIAVLRKFVDEVGEQNEILRVGLASLDLWSLSIFVPPAKTADLEDALDLIESSIEWRRGIAEANLAHLGATRDTLTKTAAENAAIWVLAAGIYSAARISPLPGKLHLREVADLSQVVLRPASISIERVRQLIRKRRQLYVDMIGNETQRHHREKGAQMPRTRRPLND